MTVPSNENRSGPYDGNGVTTIFDYGFKIVDENHIQVIKLGTDGTETVLTIDADYIVSDVGNEEGGQVALTVAPAVDETVTIIRDVPFIQDTDLENQGPYNAQTVEDALDLGVMRDQQLQEQIDRAVTIPPSADPAELDVLIEDVLRLADSADNIDVVADSVTNVNTVAASIENVNTVAGIADAVDTVAGSIAAVNTVADSDAAVNAVAGSIANVNTVGTNIAAVSTVAPSIDKVGTVADNIAAVNSAADNMAAIIEAPDAAAAAAQSAQDAQDAAAGASGMVPAATRTALAALDYNAVKSSFLYEGLRAGAFRWNGADRSAAVAADPLQGFHVAPASDPTGASGCWERVGMAALDVRHFGADPVGVLDSYAAFQAAVDLAEYFASTATLFGFAVHAPAGAYRISDTVVINDAVHVFGDGWYQTRINNVSTNKSSFYFGAADPTTAKLPGCGISNMYISYGNSDPTSAVRGVHFDRVRDAFATGLKIVNHFYGVAVYGGGETIILDNVDISGGSNLTAAAPGSSCILLDRRLVANSTQGSQDANDGLYYDHPVSVFLSNFNLRGAATTFTPDYGVQARCFDGFYISNGHMGLTTQAAIRFLPVQANLSLINLLASSVFIDPKPGVTSYGIWYSDFATASALVRNHKWVGGVCSGAINDGLVIQDADVDDVRFSAFRFSNNGRHGANITVAATDVGFDNCQFQDNALTVAGNHLQISAGARHKVANSSFTGSNVSNAVSISGTAILCSVIGNSISGTVGDAISITSTSRNHTVANCKSDKPNTFPANSTVSPPYEYDEIVITATGAGQIDTIDNVLIGRELTVYLNVGAVTVKDGSGNLDLNSDLTTAGANDVLKLGSAQGTSWREISRSPN